MCHTNHERNPPIFLPRESISKDQTRRDNNAKMVRELVQVLAIRALFSWKTTGQSKCK